MGLRQKGGEFLTLYSPQVAQKSGGFSTLARGWGQSGYGSTQNLILRRGRVARGRRGLLLAPRPTGASLASGVRRGEGGAGRGARGAGRGARGAGRESLQLFKFASSSILSQSRN